MWTLETAPALVQTRLKDFKVDDGLVRFRGLVYVPNDEEVKRWILQLYHDAIPAGHPGISNTLELVSRNYYWPRMSEYVARYVEGCEMCQKTKPRRKRPHGKLQPLEVPLGPWQHVSTDYVGPLPLSEGYDALTTLPICVIVSCRGFGLCMALPRSWCRTWVLSLLRSSRNACGSGWGLRGHCQLRAYVDYYQDDWVSWLPFAEFAYNNRFHTAIGMSPFFAEYGYHPTFSIDPVSSQSVPAADERLDRLREVQTELQSLLQLSAERMKKFHDVWVDESPDYIPGDRVYLERADLRSTRPSHKLDFRRFGPDGWTIHDVFHVSCLIPAREDTILGRKQEPPPPVMMETGEEREIERLLKMKKTRGGVRHF